MSPATFLNGLAPSPFLNGLSPAPVLNGQSPIGTPANANGAATAGANPDADNISSAGLWARVNKVVQDDAEKSNLLKEIMYRYDYISEQYKREVEQRAIERDDISVWQRDREYYVNTFRSYSIALDRNPFVLVLVDGDGMIFQDEFLRSGQKGGQDAASRLYNAVVNCIQLDYSSIPTDAQVVCRIYANVRGLADVLVRAGVIEEATSFEEFTRGLTTGKALFDFIDVGAGKDRADKKLIETFKLYAGDLHCRHMFLGCSHDNGYARTLEDYATDETYLSRVTLLQGVPFEKELLALPYKKAKFPGIFRQSKLSVMPVGYAPSPPPVKNYHMIPGLPSRFPTPLRNKSSDGPSNSIQLRESTDGPNLLLDSPIPGKAVPMPRTPSSSTVASMDGFPPLKPVMNWAAKAAAPAPPATAKASPAYKPVNREEIIARNRIGQRVDPQCRDYEKTEVDRMKKIKLCNVHFLRQECPYGANCTHLHDYKPTDQEIATLRLVARMAPCQNGSGCQDIKCIYGHRCPAPPGKYPMKGTQSCIFGEQCKFPAELHDIDCNVVKTLVVR
ncbi:hypothetical protein BDV95DRAFT_348737 [Massariosphaeria phaeospora]|uniref:C3H1-type domain-containing protein n=1 Tax=Massariosphaeria phaeospora TaxID=100035 RepID=A0A7C8I8W7_9PLEO|nr:hypothetical protein BDV95DRAFT_348737 [Massariosphaeria phaeospora]